MNALRIASRIALAIMHACVMLTLSVLTMLALALLGAFHNPRDG